MRSIEGRFRSSADALPAEMWSRAVTVPEEVTDGLEVRDPDLPYGDEVMTPRRVQAIRKAAKDRGESGQRLMRLVGVETEIE